MNFDSPTFLVLLPIICAAILNFILWLVVIYFGEGGKGVIGDIRTAIGKALPLPMAGTIWIVALTLSSQKLVEINGWDSVISMQVGDTTLGLKSLIGMKRIALIILMITWFVSRAIQAFSDLLNNWHEDKEGVNFDTTAIQALASIGVVICWVIGVVVMLQSLGMNMTAVITVGGIGGAGFAFASKDIIANFFGGLAIMFNRPFVVGDTIESGSKVAGKVTRIGLYATWLETEDGETLYIPNSIFNSSEIKKSK